MALDISSSLPNISIFSGVIGDIELIFELEIILGLAAPREFH
jgi:hypothetical protein